MEQILSEQWYPFPIMNIDHDFWDDNLEIKIRIYQTDDGMFSEPLAYCYDDGDGAREYNANSNGGPFSPKVIHRLAAKFVQANMYTMLEAA